MSDKTELYATHPETGKRHRWEIVEFLAPKRGDFVLAGKAVLPPGEKNEYSVHRYASSGIPWGYFILRDLGPVEEEVPEVLQKAALAGSLENQNRDLIRILFDREAEISSLQARVSELEAETIIENDPREVYEVDGTMFRRSYPDEVRNLQAVLARLVTRCNNDFETIANQDIELSRLQARVEEVARTNTQFLSRINELIKERDESEYKRQQAEDQRCDAVKDQQWKAERIERLEDELHKSNCNAESLEAQLAFKSKGINELIEKNNRFSRELADAENKVADKDETIFILKAQLDNATAEHSEKELRERLAASPAPLPVGVVRLPIAESADDDGNFSEFGTFRLDVLEFPQSGDVVLVPAYMRGASFQAVTVPRALPTGDRDNLRIILRRLDAPEEKTEKLRDGAFVFGKYTIGVDIGKTTGDKHCFVVANQETGEVLYTYRDSGRKFDEALAEACAKYRALAEKQPETPTPCPYCEGKGTDPLDGRWDCRECEGEGYLKPAPSQPVPNAGPITTEAWILRTANEEKPAPPKDALGTACPRCHGTGWDVPPGTVTPGKEQSPGYKCPDCLGSGIAAPPKGEPKRTALVIFRDGQAVWSSDGYPLGPSMTLHHC